MFEPFFRYRPRHYAGDCRVVYSAIFMHEYAAVMSLTLVPDLKNRHEQMTTGRTRNRALPSFLHVWGTRHAAHATEVLRWTGAATARPTTALTWRNTTAASPGMTAATTLWPLDTSVSASPHSLIEMLRLVLPIPPVQERGAVEDVWLRVTIWLG